MDNHRDEYSDDLRENKSPAVHCFDSKGNWRWIRVVQGISFEDFLPVICYDSHKAARFILDWANSDMASTAMFIAGFLAKVFSELSINSCYLCPDTDVRTSFGNRRPSVSQLAFHKFCELLIENPELISQFRNSPLYPRGSPEDRSLFENRENNRLASTRGITWDVPDFKDSCPVPLHLKLQYQEEQRKAEVRDREAQKLRDEADREKREENRRRKKQERHAVSQTKVEQRKQESALRKTKREQFLQKSLTEQVRLLALNETCPVKAFPIDPDRITSDVLEEMDGYSLDKLSSRISKQWQQPWKELAHRVDALRKK